MAARLNDPRLVELHNALRATGPRGQELAGVLDHYNTRVRFASFVAGGFTLNFINTIFLQPLRADASQWEFKYHVTLLAHEACHVEQRHWIDSVEQELRAYGAQLQVAAEMGFHPGMIRDAFEKLDPRAPDDIGAGRRAMLTLFAGQPAAIVYAALPLLQPSGWRALTAGVREVAAVIRAGLHRTA